MRKAKFLIRIVQDDNQMNKVGLVITWARFLITCVQDDQTNKAWLVITPGKGSDHFWGRWQGVSDQ